MAKGKKLALHWKIIIGLLLGVIWSVISASAGLSNFTAQWINPFGVIFIRLLKLIAIPLVLFSIITGVASLSDARKLGRMGGRTIGMYLATTAVAVAVGLLLANVINPGKKLTDADRTYNRIKYEVWAKQNQIEVRDGVCESCKSENVFLLQKAQADQGENTEVIKSKIEAAQKFKESGPLQVLVDFVPENIIGAMGNMSQMLQVIFFALLFGLALISLKADIAKPAIDFCASANEAFLKMVEMVMQWAPFFIFALTAGVFSQMAGDDLNALVELFMGLGVYMVTVVLGLMVILFGVYPLILKQILKKKFAYKKFFQDLSPAQFLAFSSSSSAATLPVTLECVTENMKVSRSTADFVLPIGATMNMNGTSLYQAVATVFLAQMHGIDLNASQYVMITLTATLASVGSAAVPSAGLVMLVMVLSAIGLNPAWIAILFPVDRILDMSRTVINVSGDAAVAAVIDHWEKRE
jgi:Na+/H+-dicarboxylate symporter